jgi:hypothetical protein
VFGFLELNESASDPLYVFCRQLAIFLSKILAQRLEPAGCVDELYFSAAMLRLARFWTRPYDSRRAGYFRMRWCSARWSWNSVWRLKLAVSLSRTSWMGLSLLKSPDHRAPRDRMQLRQLPIAAAAGAIA